MEDAELRQKFDDVQKRIDAVYVSAEKTRKYFLATLVVTLVAFILPLIGLVFAVPALLSSYSSLGGL